MKDAVIRVLSNLPRSGGTLISRCLACMDDVALLSEIHPLGAHIRPQHNPLAQAYQWYGLVGPQDLGGRNPSFIEAIKLIYSKCIERGLYLVIRDWAYIDFMGVPYNRTPFYHSRLADALADDFALIQTTIVRHPIDQWLSIAKGRILKHHLSVEAYLKGYLKYAEYAVASGFLRYEDFTCKPAGEMANLCGRLRIPFDADFIRKWPVYENITGDRFVGSVSFPMRDILPAKPVIVERELAERFRRNDDYRAAIALLGYGDVSDSNVS